MGCNRKGSESGWQAGHCHRDWRGEWRLCSHDAYSKARAYIPFQGSTESCKTHLKSALAKIRGAGMSFAAWSAGAFDQADNYELLLSPTDGKDTVSPDAVLGSHGADNSHAELGALHRTSSQPLSSQTCPVPPVGSAGWRVTGESGSECRPSGGAEPLCALLWKARGRISNCWRSGAVLEQRRMRRQRRLRICIAAWGGYLPDVSASRVLVVVQTFSAYPHLSHLVNLDVYS